MSKKLAVFTALFAVSAWACLGDLARDAEANHPVLLEGNNAANGAPGTTLVPAGTAGDYDGDGLVGAAEDADGAADRIFGTLTAALGSVNGAANRNGKVLIVTSGRFPEQVVIDDVAMSTALNGVTIIEAAPGVEADIDAVLAGDPTGNTTRQGGTGIVINTQKTDRVVILRNLEIRNWQIGVEIKGKSRVIMEGCRIDSCVKFNVAVSDDAELTLVGCSLNGAGMRFSPLAATPNPGAGLVALGRARVRVCDSNISGNTAQGILKDRTARVTVTGSCIAGNGGRSDDDCDD